MNALLHAALDAARSIPPALRERADELRGQVDDERRTLLHVGASPETLASVGALQLGWADLLDALGGRRP